MSDDDMIRRGDVLRVVYDALTYSSGQAAFVQRRIRALPAVQPKVKPLVWIEDGDGFCAKGANRTYAVFRLWLDRSTWGAVGVKHTSRDKASVMAACQADYEARILSALETAVQPVTGDPVTLTYTNWRGETAQRTIVPQRVWFGLTDWHPEPQWLLTALDAEKGAERDFALKDFGNPAVQPNAAAIREAAPREASEIAAQEGWPSIMSDAEYEAMTGIEEGSMNCATRIEAAILALIDNTGKEVMPLDAGTTETQTQAHDIGPGDQAVAGAAPVMSNQTYESLRVSGDAILHGMGLMKDGKHVPAREFYAQPEPVADAAQCWMCGKRGPQCELSDGRWVCSSDCYDVALGIMLKPVAGAAPVTVQEAARVLLKWEAQQGAVHDACSGVVKVYRFNRVLESLAALAQKGGAAPWPENLFGLTGDTLHLRCATEGCGQRVSTRFEADGISSDYCEPCGRKVALAQKRDSHE
jgi:hypothetical protein